MKNIINMSLGLLTLLFLATACEDDPTLTQLEQVSFSEDISLSTTAITVVKESASEDVLILNWEEVSFPTVSPVTYTVQFATSDDNSWSEVKSIEIGDDVYSTSITGEWLNALALEKGFDSETPGTFNVRVKAYVDRDVYSEAREITITPYYGYTGYDALRVPGDYQGWDPASALRITSFCEGLDYLYQGFVYIPEGSGLGFKLTAQEAWEPMAYGDGGDGLLIEANYSGGNFAVPNTGFYEVTADLENMVYTVTEMTWGVIGDATPGGWDADTPLTYDPDLNVWSAVIELSSSGSFKFRANNDWVVDFGVDEDGNLQFADHPVLGYVERSNLAVEESDTYLVVLDLSDPGNYTYSLIAQ